MVLHASTPDVFERYVINYNLFYLVILLVLTAMGHFRSIFLHLGEEVNFSLLHQRKQGSTWCWLVDLTHQFGRIVSHRGQQVDLDLSGDLLSWKGLVCILRHVVNDGFWWLRTLRLRTLLPDPLSVLDVVILRPKQSFLILCKVLVLILFIYTSLTYNALLLLDYDIFVLGLGHFFLKLLYDFLTKLAATPAVILFLLFAICNVHQLNKLFGVTFELKWRRHFIDFFLNLDQILIKSVNVDEFAILIEWVEVLILVKIEEGWMVLDCHCFDAPIVHLVMKIEAFSLRNLLK